MQQFEDSTLWRLSAYERMRLERSSTAFAQLGENTVLPTTLVSDLRQLDLQRESHDVLEVLAACLRHRQSALLCLRYEDLVWPLTVFPLEGLYHSPRALARAKPQSLAQSVLLSCDPPGLRPPGHWMHERIAGAEAYHALPPLLWRLALEGPRADLLHEVSGNAVFRVLRDPASPDLPTPGALGPTIDRLRRESAPLRKVAQWPGMSFERASRLVNALYLTSNLIVSRAHHAAQPGMLQSLLSRFSR